jgi:hypothetical protein
MNKIKNGKNEGPDGIKGELLKSLAESPICIRGIREGLNRVNREGRPPDSWKRSKTSMIPKTKKPTVTQMRPIALTNVGYKLYMSLLRDTIVEHMIRNDELNEFQAGFSIGRRLEDNLFMLSYCIEESRGRQREIYVAAIDYAKAFDSIDRKALIATMKRYECDSKCIEVVSRLYTGDSTEIFIGTSKLGEIEVTNGIRQGCTCCLSWLSILLLIKYVVLVLGLGMKIFISLHYSMQMMDCSSPMEEESWRGCYRCCSECQLNSG